MEARCLEFELEEMANKMQFKMRPVLSLKWNQ